MTAVVTAVLDRARADLGTTEHPDGSNSNHIVDWYNDNVSRIGNGPWCQMSVTRWFWTAGTNVKAVFNGRAYTVWSAQDFQRGYAGGTWHWGAAGIQPGDVVYFDWSGRKLNVQLIDHVGIVEALLPNGEFITIEGNIGNKCQRVRRNGAYVVGYGHPKWPADPKPPTSKPTTGTDPARVKLFQKALEVTADGDWGPTTDGWSNRLRTAARAKTYSGWPSSVRSSPFRVDLTQLVIDTKADNVWGPNSQAALLKWVKGVQRDVLKVDADGQWGPATDKAWLKLRAANLGRY